MHKRIGKKSETALLFLFSLAYLLCFYAIKQLSNPLDFPWTLVSILGYCFITYFCWLFFQSYLFSFSKKTLWFIVGTSIAVQILLLNMPLFFNDAFRYLWDGKLLTNGINPYAFFPWAIHDNPLTRHLADVWYWDKMYFKWTYAIYGPTLQYVFALAQIIKTDSATALKFLFFLCNLGSIGLGIKLLKYLKQKPHHIAWFALHPLFLYETMASAHLESVIIFFLLLTIWLYTTKKTILNGCSFALFIATKFFPVLLFPFFLIQKKWMWLGISSLLMLIVLYVPFVLHTDIHNIFSSVFSYAENWVLSPGIYDLLYTGINTSFPEHATSLTKAMLTLLLLFSIIVSLFFFTKPNNKHSLTKFLPWNRSWKSRTHLFYGIYLAFLLLIIFSSSIFSWYLLWIIPLFPFIRYKYTGVTLSVTIIFQYLLIYFDDVTHHTYKYLNNGDILWNQLLIWLPVCITAIIEGWTIYKKRKLL